ncbi:hypothetical protein SOVF_128750, partial [Spinacia oleracea]
ERAATRQSFECDGKIIELKTPNGSQS